MAVDKSKPTSFVAAMKDFFGLKDGQKVGEFAAELRALNDADKEYFRAGLIQNGYDVSSIAAGAVAA